MNRATDATPLTAETAAQLQEALSAGGETLLRILAKGTPEILGAALKNPALGEEHLLTLLRRRELSSDLIGRVWRHPLSRDSHRLQMTLARHPATPAPVLQALLGRLYLFELVDLCTLAGGGSDQKLAAERAILTRLPVTELGSKIALARRGTNAILAALLKEGTPLLVAPCLDNPRLKQSSLLQFLAGARPTAETISMIARHPRWRQHPEVQLAILKHPETPGIWFTLMLPKRSIEELKDLRHSRRLTSAQKALVAEELARREPTEQR